MNVSEAQQDALDLMDETGTPGKWGAGRLLRLTDKANRLVYRCVAARDASYFAKYTRITYPANTEGVDLTGASYLNDAPFKLTHVERLVRDEAVSPSNTATPISRENADAERADVAMAPLGILYNREETRYRVDEGWNLKLLPMPGAATVLNIRWVEQPKKLTSTSDNLLLTASDATSAVRAEEFHDLVTATLIRLLEATERGQSLSYAQLSEWLRDQIESGARDRHTFAMVTYEDPY